MLLQDWVGSNPSLLLADEPINVVDHFNYLSCLISPSGLAKEEVTQCVAKANLALWILALATACRRFSEDFSVSTSVSQKHCSSMVGTSYQQRRSAPNGVW